MLLQTAEQMVKHHRVSLNKEIEIHSDRGTLYQFEIHTDGGESGAAPVYVL